MCGRFTQAVEMEHLKDIFKIDKSEGSLPPSYNIAPGSKILSIIEKDNERILIETKWGLVPFWAKDPKIGNRLINARSETITEKGSFKHAFKKRRCLIPSSGFYEWVTRDKKKFPVHIRLKSREPFTFAGLYETWTDPNGEVLTTCTIITTEANELLSEIHQRMPVIIAEESRQLWLTGTDEDTHRLLELLKPFPSEEMEYFEVTREVNSPKNNHAGLIDPHESDDE